MKLAAQNCRRKFTHTFSCRTEQLNVFSICKGILLQCLWTSSELTAWLPTSCELKKPLDLFVKDCKVKLKFLQAESNSVDIMLVRSSAVSNLAANSRYSEKLLMSLHMNIAHLVTIVLFLQYLMKTNRKVFYKG